MDKVEKKKCVVGLRWVDTCLSDYVEVWPLHLESLSKSDLESMCVVGVDVRGQTPDEAVSDLLVSLEGKVPEGLDLKPWVSGQIEPVVALVDWSAGSEVVDSAGEGTKAWFVLHWADVDADKVEQDRVMASKALEDRKILRV